MLEMVGFKLNVEKSELEPVQDIHFHIVWLRLDQGRGLIPRFKGSGDRSTRLQSIDPAFPVIQLGSGLPAGSFAPETATRTFQLCGSDQWVASPCRSNQPLLQQ